MDLSPANRYGGFKALRARFRQHIQSALLRPVLLMDEAQQALDSTLTELRLLSSATFDSQQLLTVVLCGDERLPERFRDRELVPLGGRIRTRLHLRALEVEALAECLDHLLQAAGATHLMTPSLKTALVEHSGGNLRILTTMACEMLAYGAEHSLASLDDEIFFKIYDHAAYPR